MEVLIFVVIFIYGIVIGSFLNVCIYRIPKKENIAIVRSHCMKCDYQLKWYDLIPVFSYVALKGKCRSCGEKISIQYPVIEFLNGAFWVGIFVVNGFTVESLLYCFMTSAFIVLSVIDWRIYEIPDGINVFLAIIGVGRIVSDIGHWFVYIIGGVSISAVLLLIFILSKGRAIGGGDVKLMASAGLIVGWKNIILAFFFGCIIGSVIHVIRMRIQEEGNVLAMGPYLATGILIAALYGEKMIQWYLNLCSL
ncbi:prepilin peptidase [Anaeromicropila populeti]|uniref:Leader peptidase (Prepilin peptidase) / N-methyltransferase n=1 Tax=Anaeromicropila populeti TaxID=37658 RepID=A0A1I6INZ8_9FIRM|nr:A24 family peptidase [Anaeromicropila populeti]SFR68462.1 leader peptidase (prepilin peptidase) / N-methyltransferase [Anaeromicropila populeti]